MLPKIHLEQASSPYSETKIALPVGAGARRTLFDCHSPYLFWLVSEHAPLVVSSFSIMLDPYGFQKEEHCKSTNSQTLLCCRIWFSRSQYITVNLYIPNRFLDDFGGHPGLKVNPNLATPSLVCAAATPASPGSLFKIEHRWPYSRHTYTESIF